MGGWMPIGVVKGPDGRAIALRVMQCEAKMISGRLDIKKIEGTEKELPADLIVSAIGQAVDFTGIEEFNAGKGMIAADKNYQVTGKEGVFAGGDVIRPHLLTTAVGHGAIAADGIDQFLAGQEMTRRPKIDVHSFDLMRKYLEKGIQMGEVKGATLGTDKSKEVVHNYEDRSERYVIPHDQLFLGHFQYTDRNKRNVTHLNKDSALGNFDERINALTEAQVVAEAKRCMSCGQCFECDNCVVYCPQTAVYKVKKAETMTGRYVATDYDKCIGCHICADVCPTGYIQMGLGE
jgi:Pyruvate/2-oxoacid:ferredoxin oxidoreductase delta subunit